MNSAVPEDRNETYALIWALRPYQAYPEVARELRALRSSLLQGAIRRDSDPSAATGAPTSGNNEAL